MCIYLSLTFFVSDEEAGADNFWIFSWTLVLNSDSFFSLLKVKHVVASSSATTNNNKTKYTAENLILDTILKWINFCFNFISRRTELSEFLLVLEETSWWAQAQWLLCVCVCLWRRSPEKGKGHVGSLNWWVHPL